MLGGGETGWQMRVKGEGKRWWSRGTGVIAKVPGKGTLKQRDGPLGDRRAGKICPNAANVT